jgi:hypothetical protein
LTGLPPAFAAEQSALKDESIAYLSQQRATNQPLDPGVVHSFSTHREALANHAFGEIRSKIPKEGNEGFQRYIELEFRKSIHRRR